MNDGASRRRVLRAVGTGGALGLAGCAGTPLGDGERTPTRVEATADETPKPTETPTATRTQPPDPRLLRIDAPGSRLQVESATVRVEARNAGGPAGPGSGIAVSLPMYTGETQADSIYVDETDLETTRVAGPGDTLTTIGGYETKAEYGVAIATVGEGGTYEAGASRVVEVEFVVAPSLDRIPVLVRCTLRDESGTGTGDRYTDPPKDGADAVDQQGYGAERLVVEVVEG